MTWLRENWPFAAYAALFVWLASLFVSALPARADEVSIAVHFIAAHEGFRPAPYKDQAGNWTIGYGKRLSTPNPETTGPITEKDAERFLRQRVEELIHAIDHAIDADLHDEQWAALASICYNIGETACRDSKLFQMIDSDAPVGELIREWISWDHIHVDGVAQVSRGLSRRRAGEVGLYFFGTSDLR